MRKKTVAKLHIGNRLVTTRAFPKGCGAYKHLNLFQVRCPLSFNEATGKEEFITGDSKIGDYDLVIIDEFSMISEANFQVIGCEDIP